MTVCIDVEDNLRAVMCQNVYAINVKLDLTTYYERNYCDWGGMV